ncbi:Zn(II)2Cys6 transcription factor [Phanerochaete sordida]|uniref:Zn(II)2Cys6 transcription factor n=1 Tax=Phanerochaete sordida TaxID=48140 RepID=A0A9P3G2R9_9APHY|nr:Zn(II)2Cys6 transcription factor [Phanerochaete sordida]
MQPQPHHDQIPIDPALSMYSNSYYSYQQPPPPMVPQHLMTASLSSPSSQGSEAMGTPPMEQYQLHGVNGNGKRPSSSMTDDSRKKSRKDDDLDGPGTSNDKDEVKTKPTRGSRACTVCRRLKMKCVGAEQGPPCKRCQTGNHECIFEESNRGKRSTKKHEILTRSLRKMERTLDTVLRSLGNPSIASGMISRSPSPSNQPQGSHPLLATPSPPDSPVLPNSMHPSLPSHAPGSPKLHSLPDNTLNPLGLLAEASLANRRAQAASRAESHATANTDDQPKLGVASDVYFKPGPMTILPLRRLFIERQIQPEMLSFVSTEEVVELFRIYFDNMNFQCNLLDPAFHTPSLVCSRSPFLLTTICAIASRFYTKRPELHAKLSDLARKLAFNVPAQGYKSVEIVQAYLLNTLWGCGPVERFEQDRTWMLLGMAIRMATDLNLHRRTAVTSPDTAEGRARDKEVRNRERTWIFCFCLDRSFSAQMGKPYTIKEDFIIRNASQWSRAPNAIPSDVAIAAYADLQRILTRSLDLLYSGTNSPSGLQMDSDYLLVITTMETQILAWQHEWTNRKLVESEHVNTYRRLAARFHFNYAMLIVNSFGLQNALERSAVDIGHFFARCHSSAVACATVLRDDTGPQGYLRYAPDSTYVMGSYAVLSLLKLLRPEFKIFLDHESKIISLVNDVADTLERAAAGPMHTPALYSGFLRALVSAKTDPPSGDSEGQPTHTPNGQAHASADGHAANASAGGSHGAPLPASMGPLFDFNFESEMGPVADMSTFPPTMAPPSEGDFGMLTMDSILSASFWDSVLVPGYSNTMEGLSGGFVYGAGGSGIITPRLGLSPLPSGFNTPAQKLPTELSQQKLDVAFDASALHAPS